MLIIREGRVGVQETAKMFFCDSCGCVFTADKGEYKSVSQYNDVYFYCKCPCCGYAAREKILGKNVTIR